MTDDKIALSSLLEKSYDVSFLREMIGFAAERLMQLETGAICNAAPGAAPPSPRTMLPWPVSNGAMSPIRCVRACRGQRRAF
jgi:hypothetical protein